MRTWMSVSFVLRSPVTGVPALVVVLVVPASASRLERCGVKAHAFISRDRGARRNYATELAAHLDVARPTHEVRDAERG
jgi:hypothetical protein